MRVLVSRASPMPGSCFRSTLFSIITRTTLRSSLAVSKQFYLSLFLSYSLVYIFLSSRRRVYFETFEGPRVFFATTLVSRVIIRRFYVFTVVHMYVCVCVCVVPRIFSREIINYPRACRCLSLVRSCHFSLPLIVYKLTARTFQLRPE